MKKIENELFSFFVDEPKSRKKAYCYLRAAFHSDEKLTISGKY